MDWIASITSLAMIWLMGSRSRWGPVMGLVSQCAWLIYTIDAKAWGLMPAAIGFTVVHVRNLRLWWKSSEDL